MVDIAQELASITRQILVLDLEIKDAEARVVVEVSKNQDFYVGGKPPSMDFVKNTYKITGINGELMEKRKELAGLQARENQLKLEFQAMKEMVSIFIAESANQRANIL
jgi:hypothetical protein